MDWKSVLFGVTGSFLCFFGYVLVITIVPAHASFDNCQVSGAGENVGFCVAVQATVERTYYFGMTELPTRAANIPIDWLNRLIGPISILLGVLIQKVYN